MLKVSKQSYTLEILDQKLIEKKREDTREMCRIFNSEPMKSMVPDEELPITNFDQNELLIEDEVQEQNMIGNRRKRDTKSINPALKLKDEERVEKIVDKIYDDLLEKGHKIAYKRKVLIEKAPVIEKNITVKAINKTGRRFPFAPLTLEGPTTRKPKKNVTFDDNNKVPRFRHGIIPYYIDSKTYDVQLSEKIMKAFDYFERATCIRLQRLRDRPTDQRSLQEVVWLYITNPSGIRQCVHSNEKAEIKGVQMIVFGYDCMSLGDIAHEIMHVLGFAHEHTRPDRDQYITILWDNIKPGYKKYFEIQNIPKEEDGLPYDYASILHYPPRAFSKNGQVTVLAEPNVKIGQREGLSEMDVEKVNMVYSNECLKRNRDYLLKTCPSVVKNQNSKPIPVTQESIEAYFEHRLWPYGIVNYEFKDKMEFSSEELENINAVIRHLEKETCIEFRDLSVKIEKRPMESDEHKKSEEESNFEETDIAKNDTKTEVESTDLDTEKIDDKRLLTNFLDIENGDKPHPNNLEKDVITIEQKKDYWNVKSAYTGSKFKQIMSKNTNATKNISNTRRKRGIPVSPSRRHIIYVVQFTRSAYPGCKCPHPGRPEGKYVISINADCFNSVNDLLHLFVHILGLDHQHNMHDRDSYLHIVWDQLTDDVKQELSTKLSPAASVGFPYDYQSVMHYPWLQIKNGKTNIMYPIWNDGWSMGHWQGLSSTDVQKLNLLYFKQCMERGQHALKTENQRNKKKNK
ncbi:hypothetical protein HW555_005482 [Spodoptera exigua]|uniref:Metalloendopeptidase n=1 Tax=Spodoptera exigua TaxID=7107 RepID=A0A835L5E3_SPOEX|nr:hypothetical protein HW555_005482 [Spodoptera exigua]